MLQKKRINLKTYSKRNIQNQTQKGKTELKKNEQSLCEL